MMKLPSALAVVLAVLVAAAPTAGAAPEKNDLLGTWRVTSITQGGETVPEEFLKKLGVRMRFTENKLLLQAEGKEDETATYKIDAKKTPHEIDITDDKNRTEKGIYELKGDTLRICFADPGNSRPTRFTAEKGTKTTLIELRRDKK
jgi:uncharacterized protein (TIGR03067 family)